MLKTNYIKEITKYYNYIIENYNWNKNTQKQNKLKHNFKIDWNSYK